MEEIQIGSFTGPGIVCSPLPLLTLPSNSKRSELHSCSATTQHAHLRVAIMPHTLLIHPPPLCPTEVGVYPAGNSLPGRDLWGPQDSLTPVYMHSYVATYAVHFL